VPSEGDVEHAAASGRPRLFWTGSFDDPAFERAFLDDHLEPDRSPAQPRLPREIVSEPPATE